MAEESSKTIRKIGYARVSTADQNPDMQIAALKNYGVPESLIFVDKASGGTNKRPAFIRALKTGQIAGSEFVVWKLDRLGRTLSGVLDTLKLLEEREIEFVSLTERIDTRGPMGKAMLRLLAVFAELERDLIRERTVTGIKRKQERGEQHGRKKTMTPEREAEADRILGEGARGDEVWQAMKPLPGPPISRAAYYVWQKAYDERKALERAEQDDEDQS